MMKNKILSLLLAVCLLCTAGCAGKTGANRAGGTPANPYKGTPEPDTVTVDIQVEPQALNSMTGLDSVTGILLRAGMTGLMKLDSTGSPVPGIAEKVDVSADKKTYAFHLRKDARWSNGEPVTAHDFLFAWTKILDPKTAAPSAYVLCESIVGAQAVYDGTQTPDTLGVRVVDDTTLTVELLDPIPYALSLFAQPDFLPINQKGYEEIGSDLYGTDADKLVTNGAYRIAEWVHDSYILVEKNADYFDADSIKVPKIKYVMLGDENARINAFKSGQLDVFDIFGEQITLLSGEGEGIINAYYDNSVFCFQYNQKRPAMANAKICQALVMAIDVKSLCDNVFQDGSIPADGMTPPGISGAGDQSFAEARGSLIGYDPEKAKQLLAEGLAELGMDASALNLTYTAENSSIGNLQAQYFQQQWEQNLGLRVELELMEWTGLLQAQMNGDFDFTFSGWNPGADDPLGYLTIFASENSNNIGAYLNPAYDELILQAKREAEPAKRQEYLIAAEKMLMESGAALPIYYTRIVYASSAKVRGIACNGYQKYDFTAGAEIVQ